MFAIKERKLNGSFPKHTLSQAQSPSNIAFKKVKEYGLSISLSGTDILTIFFSLKNCKIDLLIDEYEKFSISNEETINSGFTRLNAIVTSLKYLDLDYSNKNHVKTFLRALPLKWRAKVTTIEEAKDLATVPLASYDDSDSQGGSDEDVDEKEAEAFKLMARNFCKFFCKGNRFGHGNRFGNGANRFGRGRRNSFGNKDGESSKQKAVYYNCGVEGHFASDCTKPKENKAFVGRAWSVNKDDDWIMDSGCTKYMIGNRRLFTSYKAYDGVHVAFGSNLKGNVVGGGNINHDSITITNVQHVSVLAFNLNSVGNANNKTRNEVPTTRVLELLHLDLFGPSPIQSYRGSFYTLMIVNDHLNYTWVVFVESKDDVLEKIKILCKRLENLHDCSIVSIETNHHSEFDQLQFGSFCEQHGMSYNLSGPFTSQSSEIVEMAHRKLRKMSRAMLDGQSIPQNLWSHALDMATYNFNMTSKAYIVLNKETIRIEEYLNVTFDESFPEPKSSPSIEDNRINEPIVQDLNGLPSLQVNVLDEGYPKSVKEARGHLIEQVIG
ncbi:retrovirus-related pol polyprotein from transposon TNT 1-94 [Tanacetum coccineum]